MLHTFFVKKKRVRLDIKRVFRFEHDETGRRASYKLLFEESSDDDDIIYSGFINNGDMLQGLDIMVAGNLTSGDRAFFFVTVTPEGKFIYKEYENCDIMMNASDKEVLDSIVNSNRWSEAVRFFNNKLLAYFLALLIFLPVVSAYFEQQFCGSYDFLPFTVLVKCGIPCVLLIFTLVLYNLKKLEASLAFCVSLVISLLMTVTLNVAFNGEHFWIYEYDNALLISAAVLLTVTVATAYSSLYKVYCISAFLPLLYGCSVFFSEDLYYDVLSTYWWYAMRKVSLSFAFFLMAFIVSRMSHYKLNEECRNSGYNIKPWTYNEEWQSGEENNTEPSFFSKLLNSSCCHSYHKLRVNQHFVELEIYGIYERIEEGTNYNPIYKLPENKEEICKYMEHGIDLKKNKDEISNIVYIALDQDENVYFLKKKNRSYSEIDKDENNVPLLNEIFNSIAADRKEADEADIAEILKEEGIK